MRVNIILGMDWYGTRDYYLRKPFLDGGRLKYNCQNEEDHKNLLYEFGNIARVPSLLYGIRGVWDVGALSALSLAARVYQEYQFDAVGGPGQYMPTVGPWYDTGGLSDCIDDPGKGKPFDFANDQHIEWGWERYARLFFLAFDSARARGVNPIRYTMVDDRVLCPWWGINNDIGNGMTNQHLAQRLLDRVDAGLKTLGLKGAHVVDTTWKQHAPAINAYGVHSWFNPWSTPTKSFTITSHKGIVIGVVVPSFVNPKEDHYRIEPRNGQTLDEGLAACLVAKCDEVLFEGGTDFEEGAEAMRDVNGDTTRLDILRKYSNAVIPPPQPPPVLGGKMNLAITKTPLLEWVTGVLVQSPIANDRYALRWTQAEGELFGHIDPLSTKFMCQNPNGTTEAKDVIGEWESCQPIKEGDIEIRWFTQNAEKTQSAVRVFGLQQFKE